MSTAQRAGRVFLWGPPGAGKSSLGRALALRLAVPFVDLDERITLRSGQSIATLFAQGEAAFRREERAALEELLSEEPPRVIALGGGALVEPTLRERALREGLVVSLHAAQATLIGRLAAARDRPLLGEDPGARLAALLEQRRRAYAVGHLHVDVDAASVDALADRIAAQLARGVVPLTVSSTIAYGARIVDDAASSLVDELASARPSSFAVVTDQTVASLHLEALQSRLAARGLHAACTVTLVPGEAHKTMSAVTNVLEQLSSAGLDRRSLIVGFGGGVVTDQAGLAASLYQRGVRWVAVPTTLMGMVDAATGGKTATNLGLAKNSIGTFHHPLAVLIDPRLTLTESERNVRSGLAEVVKCAAIADAALFEQLERDGASALRDESLLASFIRGALAVKCALVEEDPDERGRRALLNFGHTLGHALEAATAFSELTHGEAVAIGMVAASSVAVGLEWTTEETRVRICDVLRRLQLPITAPAQLVANASKLLKYDKKVASGQLRFALPSRIGAAELRELPLDHVGPLFARICH